MSPQLQDNLAMLRMSLHPQFPTTFFRACDPDGISGHIVPRQSVKASSFTAAAECHAQVAAVRLHSAARPVGWRGAH